SAGDVSDDAVAIAGSAAETAATSQARDGAEEHSRSGRSVGSHLGAGSGRPAAIPLGGGCGELLRADFGVGLIGRQTKAGADLETAQRALANSAGGGGEGSAGGTRNWQRSTRGRSSADAAIGRPWRWHANWWPIC